MKMNNPQLFQLVEQARKNNGDPVQMFRQITSKYKPEQLDVLFNRAKQMGVPEEYINQVKNGINAK